MVAKIEYVDGVPISYQSPKTKKVSKVFKSKKGYFYIKYNRRIYINHLIEIPFD